MSPETRSRQFIDRKVGVCLVGRVAFPLPLSAGNASSETVSERPSADVSRVGGIAFPFPPTAGNASSETVSDNPPSMLRSTGSSAAPGTPPRRSAPVAAAPRPPRPLSPHGVRRRRRPRSRMAHDRDPSRTGNVRVSSFPNGQSQSRSIPPAVGPAGELPGGEAPDHTLRLIHTLRSTMSASSHRAHRPARRLRRVPPARSTPPGQAPR